MPTVCIYCRVSSAEQERRGTIEAQRETLNAYAKQQGYTVSAIYCDDGKSAGTGKLAERDAFARLLVAAERREFTAVLVVNIDRLTRTDDLIERAAILGPLQRAGISVITPSGTIDLRTFTGDLMAGLEAAMAAMERRKILQRTQAGKERVLAKGGKPHGVTPYGLRYSKQAGWSVDSEAAAVIREIHRRVASKESCVRIALDLAARGVTPPGKRWGHTSVWSIVRQARERYAGTWLANDRLGISVPVPQILSPDEIDRAELALFDAQRRGLEHRTRRIYLFDRHAATCTRCQGWIGVRGHGREDIGYTCRNRSHVPVGHPSRCDLPIVRVDRTDGRFWDALVDVLTDPGQVDRALRAWRDRQRGEPTEAQAQLVAARERIADLDRKARALAGRVDAIPSDILAATLDKLANERRDALGSLAYAEHALARLAPPAMAADAVAAEVESLALRAASASHEERRAITRKLVLRAALDGRVMRAKLRDWYPVSHSSSIPLHRARAGLLVAMAA